ncbi:MAG: hypothetical protein A2W22_04840 [Candidatus Levybacteria bacterium RBG_16_35_11]|nr:MAG: hypothetical protein A2W22_04840 [Candidatus Levybacteria bacterium RBG_16_35_11]
MPDKLKSEVTKSRPRDEHGHFIKTPDEKEGKNIFEKFLISHTGNYKNEDDLLDIHIGNPLHRIVEILQDIKKQKAFSFTIKGSLGIAGVVLVLSVVGIFGGGKIICDKGTQTYIGTIKVLKAKEIYQKKVPILSYVLDIIAPPVKEIKNRVVLIKANEDVISLPFSEVVDLTIYNNQRVAVTGNYDVCSNILNVAEQNAVESLIFIPIPVP